MDVKRNLVVIGNGMSGARTVEEILARGGAELFNIAMFGDEPGASRDQPWRAFLKNKASLARHNVQPRELRVLAQINRLGRVIAPGDLLFILNSIRQAAETE